MRRYFNNKLYSVLDVREKKADADQLAKDWRKEGFSMRVTVGQKGRYLVWKSVERSVKAVASRRKAYRPSKRW